MTNTSFNLANGIFLPFSPEATGVGIPGQFTTWSTDNAIGPAGTPSGALLDQLTGFSALGFMQRTGAGAYSFSATIPVSAIPALTGALGAFNAAAPGNAPYYLTVPNAPVSYAHIYNGMQVSMGAPILAAAQFGSDGVGIQQALVGTVNVSSSDVAGNASYGVSGYGISNSIHTGAVGLGGFGLCGVANCGEVDAANHVVANAPTLQGSAGFDFTLLIGCQVNVNLCQKAGSVNPSGPLYGYYAVGGGNATNNTGNAFAADQLSVVTAAKWATAFNSYNGAALVALRVGATGGTQASPPSTAGSQTITFQAYTSGASRLSTIGTDPSGNILLIPAVGVGASTSIQDGLGNAILSVGTTGCIANTNMQVGAPTGGGKGGGSLNIAAAYYTNGSQVVGARDTGWTAMTGSADKATTYATSSVTLAQLAGRVMQLQAALTTHGLLGA